MLSGRLKLVSRLKERLSFAVVVSMLAIFVALGGSAFAAGILPAANSVGTPQLKAGSVTSGKVKDGTLKAVDFARNQLREGSQGSTGPAGHAGPAGVVDYSQFYSKALSDGRYLRGGIVTVVASTTIVAGSFGSATATCPAGYQATSGGADSSGVGSVFLTALEPLIEGGNVVSLSDGLHAAPTAWRAFAVATVLSNQTLKVVVICAPIG